MKHPLGSSTVAVSPLGLGAASIGNRYRAVPDDQATATVAAACRRHGVTLRRAALAFAAAHPAVASVVVGAGKPGHIERSADWFAWPAPPAALWVELVADGLLRPDAPVPA